MGSRCNAMARPLNAQAKPFKPAPTPKVKAFEPDFESLLTSTFPHVPPDLPEARTPVHSCFLERDEDYYLELQRLQRGIVVHRPDPTPLEKIADLIAQTGMVEARELSFAHLSRSRVLVHLPEGIQPDKLISSISTEPWERGLSFQRRSPLDKASISIPNFKVIINNFDLPPHLYREKAVIRATSGMGLFLGSIAQADPIDLTT